MQRVATAKWDEIVYELAFSFPPDISAVFGFHTAKRKLERLQFLTSSSFVKI